MDGDFDSSIDRAHAQLGAATTAVASMVDAERQMLASVLELWSTSAWTAAGCTGPAAWLRTHTAAGVTHARRIVSVVSLCHEHPELGAAVLSGELSVNRIGILARHATGERRPHLGPSLPAFLDGNRNGISDAQWEKAVKFWSRLADQECAVHPHRPHAIHLKPSLFGGGEIHGRLNESALNTLDAALDAFGSPPDPDGAPYRRTPAERRADALDDLAHFSLTHSCSADAAAPDACAGGPAAHDDEPFDGIGDRSDIAGDLEAIRRRLAHRVLHPRRSRRRARRAQAGVQVVIDLQSLAGRRLDDLGDIDTIDCRTRSWEIADTTARRFLCDSHLATVVMAGRHGVIDANPLTRFYAPAQRRALDARDPHCVFPSCRRPAKWCDIHHLTPHSTDGPTSLDNAATLCRFHHTLLHEAGWSLTRERDGTWIATGPSGREWCEPGTVPAVHRDGPPRAPG